MVGARDPDCAAMGVGLHVALDRFAFQQAWPATWARTRPQNVYPATNNAGLFIQMSVQISKRRSVSLI